MCASSQGIKSQAWKALFCQDLVQNNTLSKTKTKKKEREGEKSQTHEKTFDRIKVNATYGRK